MNCILRRPSGVYVARLAVPKSLRHIVGKSELIATTHQRDLRLAKVVGASIIARWRSWLLSLRPTSASTQMDILRIATGHPALSTLGDYLNLSECLAYAGLERSEALEAAAAGKLDMFVRLASCRGHIVPWDSLERYDNDGDAQVVIPQPNQLPAEAARVVAGEFRIHRAELRSLALALKSESKATVVALDDPRHSAGAFIPEAPIHITSSDVLVSAEQLERLRRAIQETISPQLLQVEQARETRTAARRQAEQAPMKISAAIHEYMGVRAVACRDDQARRIRSALDLLVELIGDHGIQDIDSSMLSDFRNTKLPEVPADENKVRLRLGTKSVSESITALRNSEYKRISANEQLKRLQWIKSFFDWLEDREWIDRNPAKLLVAESRAKAVARREAERGDSQREKFSSAHLSGIFSHGTWFQTGLGILTRAGTYREYCPYYYWLPLLGLYTGARINELAQLDLADIKLTANGTAYVSIAELDDEDLKRRKNLQSRRDVALHPHLLQLGFMPWVQALAEEGHTRLFPELKHDAVKGYGKAATKWFSRYLATLGWPRDGSLVFHSFRSTLATACINDLRLTIAETAQISGHREGKQSILERHYLKGADIDSQVALISRLDFKLPPIAQFEIGAGLKAIRDALRRKR